MVVRTNAAALFAHRNMLIHQNNASRALMRLSSGSRINSAADDAAGLAVSEKMRGQIRGLQMASRNAQNAISMLQTAEGGLNEVHAILQRMRELAVQASNGTYSDEERANLNKEYQQLMEEIDRISSYTNYNGIKLLNGTAGGSKGADSLSEVGLTDLNFDVSGNDYTGDAKLLLQKLDNGDFRLVLKTEKESLVQEVSSSSPNATFTLADGSEIKLTGLDFTKLKDGVVDGISFRGTSAPDFANSLGGNSETRTIFQIGANGKADQQMGVLMGDTSTGSLGDLAGGTLLQDTNILTKDSANAAIGIITKATNQISSQRATIGASINRLEYTIRNLDNTAENLIAAESSIRDADMALEMMNYMKSNILLQAAQAMLAQASQMPYMILELLKTM